MYSSHELLTSRGVKLYKKAKKIIPGGTQLFSKKAELFAPQLWPSYYSKAKGYKVWDLDNRCFWDMSMMSVGQCILGYADQDVDRAVLKCIKSGVNCTLSNKEEVELARLLMDLHPWFQGIRYARSGGEAMAIAVRIARAHTNKEIVLFNGYHGWSDWFLSASIGSEKSLDNYVLPGLRPTGVPNGLKKSSFPFDTYSLESLDKVLNQNKNKIAAIVVDPAQAWKNPAYYLQSIREIATKAKGPLIFDEITSGFRVCPGGMHREYAVYPDIAVFAKSIANGYAMAAILGSKKIMASAQDTFISSSNWTDRIGPCAAIATIQKYIETKAQVCIRNYGHKVNRIWKDLSKKFGLNIEVTGLPSLTSFDFISPYKNRLHTLYTIEMLKDGFLASRQFRPSVSHDEKAINRYSISVDRIFKIISEDRTGQLLVTQPQQTHFLNLNEKNSETITQPS